VSSAGPLNAIRRVVWDSDTRAGRLFDATVLTVIVAGLIVDATATLPSLDEAANHILALVSAAVTTLFVTEYVLRIASAEHRWKYVVSFYGIVDLVAILPTLLGLDLRALRAVRLIRLLRVLKITRAHALSRFGRALWSVRDEGLIFLLSTVLVLYLAAAGIYYFEHEAQPEAFGSIPESLWWAVATLTTVGYGDTYPITAGGRLFTALVLLCGMGIVAVPAGLVATALTKAGRPAEASGRPPVQ
jgi:voltage-gated potassium channel